MSVIKHHNCALFELNPGYTMVASHANCGICKHYNKTPPAPTKRNCFAHGEHVAWIKKNFRADWKD